ncbi:hypothetical protein M3Y95_00457900 [Aphelenchoides besseyi]|nr:hypothetical protein M3Y95_00457900 [Aphelenchoides besseyi]
MSRPQLTTNSKAILLMHRIKYVCDRPPDNKMSASEFLKYLLISRQFVRASQLHQVYQFAIFDYCCDDEKFDVSAMKAKALWPWAAEFKLKLKEIRSLNLLLNAQYVYVQDYEFKYAKEFSAVCKIFTGHIAMNLSDDVEAAENHSSIVKQVQKQLYSLRGNAKSLIASPDMPQLDLAFGGIDIENLYQFKQVMAKHRIKEMWAGNDRIYSPNFDAKIDDNFFDDFPTCPSVEMLKFNWKELNEDHDLVSKVTRMIPFFPKLRKLYCCFRADHYTAEQFSLQQMVVWIRNECKKLEELQKTKLPITEIGIAYDFKIRKPESSKVVKKLVKKILKTTTFNRVFDAKLVTPKPDNKDKLIKQHYAINLWQRKPYCLADVQFTIDLDPLTLDDEDLDDVDSSADEND